MPRDHTIGDVSKTLVDLLKLKLTDIKDRIALVSPKDAGTNVLTLFLYKVLENAYLKNQPEVSKTNASGKVEQKQAPLTVDLYYLLTAHPQDTAQDPTDPVLDSHIALSRAMRVFYDNGVLRGSLIHTNDAAFGFTSDTVLRLTLNPITMEDMTRIWSVFPDTPYEISVAYLVTPVPIESDLTLEGAPVVDQDLEHGHRGAELAP